MHGGDGRLDIICITYQLVSLFKGNELLVALLNWFQDRQSSDQDALQSFLQEDKKRINSETKEVHAW